MWEVESVSLVAWYIQLSSHPGLHKTLACRSCKVMAALLQCQRLGYRAQMNSYRRTPRLGYSSWPDDETVAIVQGGLLSLTFATSRPQTFNSIRKVPHQHWHRSS